jgi:hypothetical protein
MVTTEKTTRAKVVAAEVSWGFSNHPRLRRHSALRA